MTRIAVISDIHADADALRDALRQIERLKCDLILCAGDILDYGRLPKETLRILLARDIHCIRGNHDFWALGEERMGIYSKDMLELVKGLPSTWGAVVDGVRIAMHHGSPRSLLDGIYPDLADDDILRNHLATAAPEGADVLIVGHTHVPFRIEGKEGMIVNPGALLVSLARTAYHNTVLWHPNERSLVYAPRPGAGGTFGVIEVPSRQFTVHRASDGGRIEIRHRIMSAPGKADPS